jgi:hypothetical protein
VEPWPRGESVSAECAGQGARTRAIAADTATRARTLVPKVADAATRARTLIGLVSWAWVATPRSKRRRPSSLLSALAIAPCDSGVFLVQIIRQFAELAAGCNTADYASVSPPASNFYTYNMAVANSCTDTYM